MKGLKKMNIGLLMAIITVILVIAYCIHVESARKSSKGQIMEACGEFIKMTDKYAVLPSEYQKIGIKSTEVDLTNYKKSLKEDLEKQTINSGVADIEATILEQIAQSQLIDTRSVITESTRKVVNITSTQFTGNQVTVTFNSRLYVKQKYNDVNAENGEITEKSSEVAYDLKGDTIILEKVNDDWKVVYSNLKFAGPNSSINKK